MFRYAHKDRYESVNVDSLLSNRYFNGRITKPHLRIRGASTKAGGEKHRGVACFFPEVCRSQTHTGWKIELHVGHGGRYTSGS